MTKVASKQTVGIKSWRKMQIFKNFMKNTLGYVRLNKRDRRVRDDQRQPPVVPEPPLLLHH